MDLFEIVDLD